MDLYTRYISVRVKVEVLVADADELARVRDEVAQRAADAIEAYPAIERIAHVGTVTRRPHASQQFASTPQVPATHRGRAAD